MDSCISVLLLGDANVGKRSLVKCASGLEPIQCQLHNNVRTYAGIVSDISLLEYPPSCTPNYTLYMHKDRRPSSKNRRALSAERKPHPEAMEVKLLLLTNEPEHYDESSEFREKFLSPNRVIGICYNICDRTTLESAVYKWFPMARYYNPTAPVFLIGCMSDLKHDTSPEMIVSEEQALVASKEIGAVKWLECTSLDWRSIQDVSKWLAWYGHRHLLEKEELELEEKTGCIIL